MVNQQQPYVIITEEPTSKPIRFKYECEGRRVSIPGISSTPTFHSFVSIQVVGYQGPAVVVVSCITKDKPYRAHPHELIGMDGCKHGVCTIRINPDTMSATFPNLGVQCVKRKNIKNALEIREKIRVDPFRTGFKHKKTPEEIDLNSVRLCFQVFLEGNVPGKYTVPLSPIASKPIYDRKSNNELCILKLSDSAGYVDGSQEIIILCEKIVNTDIEVRFYEKQDEIEIWDAIATLGKIHKNIAISLKVPQYHSLHITEPIEVFVQLRRPSDKERSPSLPFLYLPLKTDCRKRKRYTQIITSSQNTVIDQNCRNMNNIPDEQLKILDSIPQSNNTINYFSGKNKTPYIRIIEEPASKIRFRYGTEAKSAGIIVGITSTKKSKTYPAIEVIGYKGKAVVVVSCVTKDKPYRPHPYNLVGREGYTQGVCTMRIDPTAMSIQFPNMGIQCVKVKDIEKSLNLREQIKVDPFKRFTHKNHPNSIDLHALRLCFQVFLEGNTPEKYTTPLKPIVSEPIYNKKRQTDLIITKLSHCVCSVDGGQKDIILLCEKVSKDDIQIRFFEEKNMQIVWESFVDLKPSQIYRNEALWFQPPKYHNIDITEPVKVFLQLRQPSDGIVSDPLPFEYVPITQDPNPKRRKQEEEALFRNLVEVSEQEPNFDLNAVISSELWNWNIPLNDISKQHEAINTKIYDVEPELPAIEINSDDLETFGDLSGLLDNLSFSTDLNCGNQNLAEDNFTMQFDNI